MDMMGRFTQKLAGYLRSRRAVSALEYALVVGISAVAVAGAYEAFRTDIVATMTTLAQQISGGN